MAPPAKLFEEVLPPRLEHRGAGPFTQPRKVVELQKWDPLSRVDESRIGGRLKCVYSGDLERKICHVMAGPGQKTSHHGSNTGVPVHLHSRPR